MVAQKDKTQIALAKALKIKRNEIRLKYTLMADEECYEVLPEVEREFWRDVGK